MKKSIWETKWEIIKAQRNKESMRNTEKEHFQFYHYTSLPVLFNILEGDAFWASNVRFSNDAMEEKLLKLDHKFNRDDYAICFCSEDDILSQWRGYCHEGGASIKLDIRVPVDYSILHSDYEQSGKYQICENTPLPVIYIPSSTNSESKKKEIKDTIAAQKGDTNIELEDILPYLKNNKFFEEKESRMVFSNIDGKLSKCIRFRTLKNGVKVPYIIVKAGNIGKMYGNCLMNIDDYDDDILRNHMVCKEAIWIEEGADQEKKYYEMMERIKRYEKENAHLMLYPFKVFCKGHLPVEQIRVAPTYDKDRIAEQVERFCKSKYWLRNVTVLKSEIPYIKPMA